MTRFIHRSNGKCSNSEPVRIALFQALNLGDLLCTTPALRAVRTHFPDAEITFIGKPWAEDFLARLSSVDRFEAFPGFPGIAESPSVEHRLDRSWPAFDLAIQMHGSGEISNGFVAMLGARDSVGFGPVGEQRLTKVLRWIEREPEPLRWLRLVETTGALAMGYQTEFPIRPAEHEVAARLLGLPDDRPVIGLHVGASDPNRRWPSGAFAELGKRLLEIFGARIVLTGSDQERNLTARVNQLMGGSAIDLAGCTTLGDLAAVISALDLIVTNDTGASHVAAATRTPSVVLFGPTQPDRWAQLDRERHLVIDATRRPGAPSEGVAALKDLSVDFVFAECQSVLRAALATSRFAAQERVAWVG